MTGPENDLAKDRRETSAPSAQQQPESQSEDASRAPRTQAEIVEKPSRSVRHIIEEFGLLMQRGPAPLPFADKITEQHIHRALDISEKQIELEYKNRNSARTTTLWMAGIGAAALLFLVVFLVLQGKDSMVMEITKILISFLGGFGSGYGYKVYMERYRD